MKVQKMVLFDQSNNNGRPKKVLFDESNNNANRNKQYC